MRTKFLFPVVLAVITATASADLIVESKIESPQMNSTVTTKIKDGKVRADLTGPMGAMSSIIDSASGNSIQLIHGQKMAMKTSAAQMKQAIEMSKQLSGTTPDKGPPAKPQATGQKEKVGEYECEIYTWTGGGTTSRFWVALKHPQAALLKEAEKQMRSGVLGTVSTGPDMTQVPGPALKTETQVATLKTVATILSVKEATLNASDFEVPKDYQEMDMSKPPGATPPAPPAPK